MDGSDLSQVAPPVDARAVAAPAHVTWELLYARYFQDVMRLALRTGLSTAEAEDTAQKVFLRAHDHLLRGTPIEEPRAWLRGITVRVASEQRRWVRVRRLAAALLGATLEAARPTPEDPSVTVDERRDRERISRVLAQMSPRLREVLVLTDLHDCDQRETAAALGIPENTVRSRRARGREQFRQLWQTRSR